MTLETSDSYAEGFPRVGFRINSRESQPDFLFQVLNVSSKIPLAQALLTSERSREDRESKASSKAYKKVQLPGAFFL